MKDLVLTQSEEFVCENCFNCKKSVTPRRISCRNKLFKKLQNDIWEFRIRYNGLQIRLLDFWDKSDGKETFVFATHGFIKKVDKVPSNEIDRAVKIRTKYFENKLKK